METRNKQHDNTYNKKKRDAKVIRECDGNLFNFHASLRY